MLTFAVDLDEEPDNAMVLCIDEESQVQALNRTQKVLVANAVTGVNGGRSADFGGPLHGGFFVGEGSTGNWSVDV